jgi:outer membrane protein TolC
LEQESIRLSYAENQLKPKLDLNGSYGFNGLGKSYGSSLSVIKDGNYDKWTLGLSFSSSLGGNKKIISEYAAARLRKIHAVKDLNLIEVELRSAIKSSIERINNSWNQITALSENWERSKKQFEIEKSKLSAGQSTVRSVLDRENESNRTHEMLLTSETDYKKLTLALYHLDGTLLRNFGLESADSSHGWSSYEDGSGDYLKEIL